MRQIKFRGKRIDDGEWIYGYLADVQEQYGYATINYDFYDGEGHWESCDNVDVNTIGQFTGLYDKNGKEIYEGDILLWHTMYLSVEWRQEDCRYVLVGCHDNEYVLNAYKCNIEDDFEVIGNIHEK